MTPRQSQILKFVNNFWEENDYSPSLKEIQDGLKITSYTSVAQCCNGLVERGYISKDKYKKRNLNLTDQGESFIKKSKKQYYYKCLNKL